MGCLNSNKSFNHWFGNIHLSGPCNRSCYFCIGQHMMALDSINNLKLWPLVGLDSFINKCIQRNVTEIYLTGTNTDPLLFEHTKKLREALPKNIKLGFRTNGAALKSYKQLLPYNMGSVTVCSFNNDIHKAMMGSGYPVHINKVVAMAKRTNIDLKVNIVLGPENIGQDLYNTLNICSQAGIKRANLREPYGQPHVGDPIANVFNRVEDVYGCPTYQIRDMKATYWDVHYTEVESVNLYANGTISEDYPITRGHDVSGNVLDQANFIHGRHHEQWISLKKKPLTM